MLCDTSVYVSSLPGNRAGLGLMGPVIASVHTSGNARVNVKVTSLMLNVIGLVSVFG